MSQDDVAETAKTIMQVMLALQPVVIMMAIPFGAHLLRAFGRVLDALEQAKKQDSPGGEKITSGEKANALALGLESVGPLAAPKK